MTSMAKTWQYGRWRGVALQVVMWLIFGSSLGLAAYIDHRRSGTLSSVDLLEPRTFGRLSVRLPKDWSIEGEAGPPQALVAKDFDRQGRERPTLRITQEQQGTQRRGPEFYLQSIVKIPQVIAVGSEPFQFLGQDDAILMPLRFSLRGRVPEGIELGLPDPGLYACAVLPDGLTVTVQVVGEGQYGPSSRRLLRTVADSIKLADNPAATGPTR